jgi:hypothetical protein
MVLQATVHSSPELPDLDRPTDVIRRPFDLMFPDARQEIADPELRRIWVADTIPKVFSALTEEVWMALIKNEQYKSPHSDLPIARFDRVDGEVLIRGLDFSEEVDSIIVPQMEHLLLGLSNSESDINTDEALARMAGIVGTAVAETQSFDQGNTRVARAMHDFILYGTEGLKNENIYSVLRNFLPDADVEHTILEQNVTRLLRDSDGIYPEKGYEPYGGVYVEEQGKSMLALANGQVKAIRRVAKAYATTLWNVADVEKSPSSYIPGALDKRLSQTLKDYGQRKKVIRTIMQKEYGGAAWAVAFKGQDVEWPLNETDAEALIEADRSLLVMRIISLMTGIAAGGTFVSLETSEKPGKESDILLNHWLPTAMLLADSTKR